VGGGGFFFWGGGVFFFPLKISATTPGRRRNLDEEHPLSLFWNWEPGFREAKDLSRTCQAQIRLQFVCLPFFFLSGSPWIFSEGPFSPDQRASLPFLPRDLCGQGKNLFFPVLSLFDRGLGAERPRALSSLVFLILVVVGFSLPWRSTETSILLPRSGAG